MSCSTWMNSTSIPGSCLLDLGAQLGDDLVHAAVALGFQLDGDVAGVGLGHGGQTKLQAGAARVALDLRELAQHLLDVRDHAVGFVAVRCPAGMM